MNKPMTCAVDICMRPRGGMVLHHQPVRRPAGTVSVGCQEAHYGTPHSSGALTASWYDEAVEGRRITARPVQTNTHAARTHAARASGW